MADTAKVDWRKLPAGLTLDWEIAERLGWTNLEFHQTLREEDGDVGMDDVILGDSPNTTLNPQRVPSYSTDANAALSLIEDTAEGNDYLLRKLNTGWHIHAYWGNSGKITATEATIPLTICRAWLIWKDTNRG